MAIQIKRVYDKAQTSDGTRVLVDRLWPRGVSRSTARLDRWLRDIGPSNALRKWFGHKPERWKAFEKKYRHELQSPERRELLNELRRLASKRRVTLLFGASDRERNNAVVVEKMLKRSARRNRSVGG
jgi:uncharacterized protein YeaO (DUF488 family)